MQLSQEILICSLYLQVACSSSSSSSSSSRNEYYLGGIIAGPPYNVNEISL